MVVLGESKFLVNEVTLHGVTGHSAHPTRDCAPRRRSGFRVQGSGFRAQCTSGCVRICQPSAAANPPTATSTSPMFACNVLRFIGPSVRKHAACQAGRFRLEPFCCTMRWLGCSAEAERFSFERGSETRSLSPAFSHTHTHTRFSLSLSFSLTRTHTHSHTSSFLSLTHTTATLSFSHTLTHSPRGAT